MVGRDAKFYYADGNKIKKFKIIKFELRINFLSEPHTPTLLATTLKNLKNNFVDHLTSLASNLPQPHSTLASLDS